MGEMERGSKTGAERLGCTEMDLETEIHNYIDKETQRPREIHDS